MGNGCSVLWVLDVADGKPGGNGNAVKGLLIQGHERRGYCGREECAREAMHESLRC
jgi:hypothetical protein